MIRLEFKIGDAPKPEKMLPSGCFKLKSPIPLQLAVDEERNLDMGLSVNFPTHIIQSKDAKKLGLVLVDGVWAAHDADQQIVVKLKNVGKDVLYMERGETIAILAIFNNSEFDVKFV